MKLANVCIITKNVKKLTKFYEEVLGIEPALSLEIYVEFQTADMKLSIFNFDSHEEIAKDSITLESNRSVMFEFQVEDVDREYEKLKENGIEFVKMPSTQQWGTRSVYFRDPEGNLISLFAYV